MSLRNPDHEDRIFNRVISDISVVLWETTLTISESLRTGSPVESEIVRVVSLSTTEIPKITRYPPPHLQGPDTIVSPPVRQRKRSFLQIIQSSREDKP